MCGHILYVLQQVEVVVLVGNSYDKAWTDVQGDTDAPEISLGTDSGYGTDAWYEVEYLCGIYERNKILVDDMIW